MLTGHTRAPFSEEMRGDCFSGNTTRNSDDGRKVRRHFSPYLRKKEIAEYIIILIESKGTTVNNMAILKHIKMVKLQGYDVRYGCDMIPSKKKKKRNTRSHIFLRKLKNIFIACDIQSMRFNF